MRRETTRSRELVHPCECGRPVMHYVTSEGRKAAPYCHECAKTGSGAASGFTLR